MTAARALDKPDTKTVWTRTDLPLRMSALKRLLEAHGSAETAAAARELEREARICAPPICVGCGQPNPDPVVTLDVDEDRMVYGCPRCSGPEVLARWESEA